MNAIEPPMSKPMKVFTSATLICVSAAWKMASPFSNSPAASFNLSWPAMVSMYEANSATAAMTAEPIAKPLVTALVVLPTASRLTMILRGSPSNSPAISAIPAALSATGPKVSSDTITPVVASMPMPHKATRYSESRMLPPPNQSVPPSEMAMQMIAYTDDSRPDAVPDNTTVAGPVSADAAISSTGPYSVPVKYSVSRLNTCARTKPISTAPKTRQPIPEMATTLFASPKTLVFFAGLPM